MTSANASCVLPPGDRECVEDLGLARLHVLWRLCLLEARMAGNTAHAWTAPWVEAVARSLIPEELPAVLGRLLLAGEVERSALLAAYNLGGGPAVRALVLGPWGPRGAL